MDDFELSCKGMYRALAIREKYMRLAFQRFPLTSSQYLREIEGEPFKPEHTVKPGMQTRLTSLNVIERACLGYACSSFS